MAEDQLTLIIKHQAVHALPQIICTEQFSLELRDIH